MTLERFVVRASSGASLLRGAALRRIYGVETGTRVRVGPRGVIRGGSRIRLGNRVVLTDDTWLNVINASGPHWIIDIGDDAALGRRTIISAALGVTIGARTIFGPNVLVTDHNHEWSLPDVAVRDQGISDPLRVEVGKGCWVGANSILLPGVRLPDFCVVAANSVVCERSIPLRGKPARLIGGAPARVLR